MKHEYIPSKVTSSTVGQRSHIRIHEFYKGLKYCCVAFNISRWTVYKALDGLNSPSLHYLLLFLEWPQVANNSRFVGNWSRQSWLSQCQPYAGATGAKEEAAGSSKEFLSFKWTVYLELFSFGTFSWKKDSISELIAQCVFLCFGV